MSGSEYNIIVFDLEGSGDRASENPILEIGAVIKNPKGETVSTFQECGLCEKDQYEPRCVDEFWSIVDPHGVKRKRYASAQSAHDLWKHFYDWLVKHSRDVEIHFVSDNPSFDCGIANQNFDRYFHGASLRYLRGRYTKTRDSSEGAKVLAAARGMSSNVWKTKVLEWYFEKNATVDIVKTDHDHDPLHDANYIANVFLACSEYSEHCAKNRGTAPF